MPIATDCPLLPCADYVVLVADAAPTHIGSIVLNAAWQPPSKRGTIVAVGPDTSGAVAVGDSVQWRRFAATTVAVGDDEFQLVREDDLLMRFEA